MTKEQALIIINTNDRSTYAKVLEMKAALAVLAGSAFKRPNE